MTRLRPSFPPDVAAALQEPEGEVSVRYTFGRRPDDPPQVDTLLMETPYARVLAALVLDTRNVLRFVRTGSRDEGARVALVDVSSLRDAKHWDITLRWDADSLCVTVRDQQDPARRAVTGTWPR